MPNQKDLKKVVRARMQKTGEAYTTARLHVVNKKKAPEPPPPPPDYAQLAGTTDATIEKNTGRNWAQWVQTLDAIHASEKPHREIAEHVFSLGVSGWWSQSVTVGYERIRGLRDKGQRRGGSYEVNKSRTVHAPIDRVYGAIANATKRRKWLTVKVNVRTATANKSIRAELEDGTLAQFYFVAKGENKTAVTVQQQKLADKETATRMKEWWSARFDALAELLE